jgi:GTP-binding protein
MQIWLVGATNVGKSTLFNRLIGQFRAIVTDIPGTTRDIIYHKTHIDELGEVIFADSPGLEFKDERPFIQEIVDTSDTILFLIDDSAGITAKEQHILEYIRKQHKTKQTLLVVNKLDIKRKESETDLALSDYHKLGFETLIGISAKKKRNLIELQDELLQLARKYMKEQPEEETDDIKNLPKPTGIALAILGKPNVGKSTLLNTLAKKQLSKVEDFSGTTRDYIVGDFIYEKKHYTVYDTAGFRKKGRMQVIEKIAYKKTIDMLKYIRPIVLFLIDSIEDISHRDMTLLQEINNIWLSIIVGFNKTDLLSKKEIETFSKKIQAYLNFAKYIPIIPMVATTGKGIKDVMKMVSMAHKEMNKRINTNELNTIITKEFIERPPRFPKNKICKLMYITQADINAPTFIAFVNKKDRANFAFKKWIDNSIRKHFWFIATPLVIKFKDEKEKDRKKKN